MNTTTNRAPKLMAWSEIENAIRTAATQAAEAGRDEVNVLAELLGRHPDAGEREEVREWAKVARRD